MALTGKAFRFGDDVNTDLIISGKYKFKTLDMKELAKHVLEDARPNFYGEISAGDFVVAGRNFGCGSSREQAPLAIKFANISGVITASFARIFYRNAINVGLPVIICKEAGEIAEGNKLSVDLQNGKIVDETKGITLNASPIPPFMTEILNDGGLIEYFNKGKGFDHVM